MNMLMFLSIFIFSHLTFKIRVMIMVDCPTCDENEDVKNTKQVVRFWTLLVMRELEKTAVSNHSQSKSPCGMDA